MAEEKKRILITGGNGYLARTLIRRLLNDDRVELIVALDTAFENDEVRLELAGIWQPLLATTHASRP